ncbi:hypothetical protein DL767_009722 [Monosporascus sp. MG133]|nr:hypothetical protein DL767_009722 [Monosporascus sp. MG133]
MSESNAGIAHTESAPVVPRAPRIMLRKVKRIDERRMKKLIQWLFDNQTGLAFHTITPLLLTHICIPAARPHTSKFFKLSYHNPVTGKYGAGHDDLCFVAFCVVLCVGIRSALMRHVLAPLAFFGHWEWYRTILYPRPRPFPRLTGVQYLYCKSPYYLNMKELWANWPQRELDGLMKGYILAQWAYWAQQVISVNTEARRKDYWEMIVHHAITISLIAACYAYHQTRVGHLILVLMDVIELIFPLAKCLKYIGFTTLCDVVFGVFLFLWVWTRHVFYLMTCWSVYYDLPRALKQPCFRGAAGDVAGPFPAPEEGWSHLLEPFRDPAGTVCFTDGITKGFLTFLLALEVLICAWSFFIIRVSVRVLKGAPAEDVRSDVEVDEEEEEGVEYEEVETVGEHVGVESIDLKAWERRTGKKETGSRVSGVRAHRTPSDRKELLNRIGCEKQID